MSIPSRWTPARLARMALPALMATALMAMPVTADCPDTTFDGYALGDVALQNGGSAQYATTTWTRGDNFTACQTTRTYDQAIVEDSTGRRVLRISNYLTNGTQGAQISTPSAPLVAGETGSALWNDRGTNGCSPTARQAGAPAAASNIYGMFMFRSATGAAQPGLQVNLTPWGRQSDTRGYSLTIIDPIPAAGATSTGYELRVTELLANGTFPAASTTIATGISYTDLHKLELVVDYVDGVTTDSSGDTFGNDVVSIYLNDSLIHTGTTWECFWRTNPGGTVGRIQAADAFALRLTVAAPDPYRAALQGAGFDITEFFVGNAKPNRAPTAGDDAFSTDEEVAFTLSEPGLMPNVTDDGLPMTGSTPSLVTVEIVTQPSNGTITNWTSTGSFTYTPDPWFFGEDTFTYRSYDGDCYSAPATVTITVNMIERPVTVDITASDRAYDGTDAATVTYGEIVGLAPGSTVTLDTSAATASFADRNVGTAKTVTTTGAVLSGDTLGRYTLTVGTDTADISAAPLVITAVTDTKTYDGTASSASTPAVTGLFAPDTVTGLVQAFADRHAGSGKTLAVQAGYTVEDGNSGNNYYVDSAAPATGTITPAALVISAVTDTKTYDGTTASTGTPTVSGLQAGDSVTGLVQAYGSKDVLGAGGSTLSVVAGTIEDGNGGANYVPSLVSASGTISPAPLTITAPSATKTYDALAYPGAGDTPTATFSGFVAGEGLSALGGGTLDFTWGGAASQVDAGTYAVVASGLTSTNYAITYVDGSLAILKATQQITWATPSEIVYGTALDGTQLNATVAGVPGGTAAGALAYSPAAGTVLAPGTRTLTVTAAATANYMQATASVQLLVTSRGSEAWYTGQTLHYTKSSSDTAVQVTLSATVNDLEAATPLPPGTPFAGATVDFVDVISGKVLAKDVPISATGERDGIVTTFATLSTGTFGAEGYVIRVVVKGNYLGDNDVQRSDDLPSTTVYVTTPPVAGQAKGAGYIDWRADVSASTDLGTEGALATAIGAGDLVGYSVSLQPGSGKRAQHKGQVVLVLPGPDGSMYYVKSNSITSVAVTFPTTVALLKASVWQVLADGSTVSIEGGVSLRVELVDGAPDRAAFTVTSAKTSALFYSNWWVKSGKAWKTSLQDVTDRKSVV